MSERLGRQLHLGGLEQNIHTGLMGGGLFGGASLDLNFALNKNIGPLVTFTRASSGTFVGSDGLVKTAAVNEPRFDHNPTTGESLGLLVEEQRTNLLLRSEEFGTTWDASNFTVSADTTETTAPNGTVTADKITGSSAASNIKRISQIVTLSAIPYAFSVYAKASNQNFLQIRTFTDFGNIYANFDIATGVVGTTLGVTSASVVAVGSGWYRCQVVFTPAAATSSLSLNFITALTSSSPQNTTLTTSLYLWGAQLEAGAFPTSYIPTTSATVTRAADVASITGSNFSSWYNHSEGTLRASASIRGGNTVVSTGLAIINGVAKLAETAVTVNSRSIVFNTSTSPNRFGTIQRSAAANVAINDNTYEAIQLGKYYNLTTSYVNNSTQGLALSVDGRTVITNATAVDVPVPTRLLIGAGNSGSNTGVGIDEYYLNGTIKRLTFWPQRLPNATLQQITQP